MADDEYVDIVHEETHGTARVTKEAFDLVWSKTKPPWKKASEDTVAAEEKKAERAAARRES